jgi:hypothetical protein
MPPFRFAHALTSKVISAVQRSHAHPALDTSPSAREWSTRGPSTRLLTVTTLIRAPSGKGRCILMGCPHGPSTHGGANAPAPLALVEWPGHAKSPDSMKTPRFGS